MNMQDGCFLEPGLMETMKFLEEDEEDDDIVELFPFPETSLHSAEEKELRAELLRTHLPQCQPQEGSPANTFTDSELQELQASLPLNLRPAKVKSIPDNINVLDIRKAWTVPEPPLPRLDWHGAPRFSPAAAVAREFRQGVREGRFTSPTNGVCPGFLQCNLVVLPQGKHAFDFLLFCQRNPKACPLLEVCDTGSPVPMALAPGADLRTDCPKYAIYRHGKLEKEVHDVTNYWQSDSVAFLIGCSFSYDGALLEAGIPLRSAEQGKNVPMYRTNLKCRPAGSLSGRMVVSMKPIPALHIAKHVEITSKYPHAHGGPLCVGRADTIGIANLNKPDWGSAVEMHPDDIPVFHACGVTPQSILMESKVPFAITHAAGHMFVTDMPSHMNGVL